MKKTLLACVLGVSLLVAAIVDNTMPFAYSVAVASPAAGQESTKELYAWQGTINDTIPVSVWFEVKNGVAVGAITYTKTGSNKPIFLLGKTLSGKGSFYLNEVLPDGVFSGTIEGSVEGDIFSGTWTGPDTVREKGSDFVTKEGKVFPITLHKNDNTPKGHDWALNTASALGNYAYSYGKYQPHGTGAIHALDADRITIELFGSRGAPSYNMATVDALDCQRQGNSFFCDLDESCAVTVQVFNGFIKVGLVEDRNCLGYFGMGAHVEGSYIKLAQ